MTRCRVYGPAPPEPYDESGARTQATFRSATSSVTRQQGTHTYRVVVPADSGTANPPASIGNVMPFGYAEALNPP